VRRGGEKKEGLPPSTAEKEREKTEVLSFVDCSRQEGVQLLTERKDLLVSPFGRKGREKDRATLHFKKEPKSSIGSSCRTERKRKEREGAEVGVQLLYSRKKISQKEKKLERNKTSLLSLGEGATQMKGEESSVCGGEGSVGSKKPSLSVLGGAPGSVI